MVTFSTVHRWDIHRGYKTVIVLFAKFIVCRIGLLKSLIVFGLLQVSSRHMY